MWDTSRKRALNDQEGACSLPFRLFDREEPATLAQAVVVWSFGCYSSELIYFVTFMCRSIC